MVVGKFGINAPVKVVGLFFGKNGGGGGPGGAFAGGGHLDRHRYGRPLAAIVAVLVGLGGLRREGTRVTEIAIVRIEAFFAMVHELGPKGVCRCAATASRSGGPGGIALGGGGVEKAPGA